MRQFHTILARYTPLVEGYVLDARRLSSGRALVQLTVLVHPATTSWLINQMYVRLTASEDQDDLREIVQDFDLDDTAARIISFCVLVKPLAVESEAQHA